MNITKQVVGDYVVLYAEGMLTTGGRGEEFERHIQNLFQEGHRHVVVDLARASMVDSSGIRALVRGYTTSQRLGGSFTLLNPGERLLRLLRTTRLDTVLPITESIEALQSKRASR